MAETFLGIDIDFDLTEEHKVSITKSVHDLGKLGFYVRSITVVKEIISYVVCQN